MLSTSSDVSNRRRRCRPPGNKENQNPLPQPKSTPLLAAFRKAIQTTSQADFWNQNESLVEIVVEYASDNTKKKRGPSLLLNENASSIVKSCRTLIKEAVSTEKKNVNAFFVAVIAVRAILTTRPAKKMETIVRLLYHAIIACAEMKNERAGTVGLAAYEALGNALSMALHNHQGKTASTTGCAFPNLVELVSPGETIPGMSNDQLLDIGIYSTLAAVRMISFCLDRKQKPVDDALELQIEIQWDTVSTLLCDVALSWMQRVPDAKKQSSFSKQGHRLLWDLANHSDQKLHLQADSIRVLLLDGESSLNFENACTYSWKAAESFRQKFPDNPKDLRSFHEAVGKLLDQIASHHQQQQPTRFYTEYCAYRAFHLGSFGIQVNRVPVEHHEEDCVFFKLEYDFRHPVCSAGSSSSRDEVFMSLFFLTLKVGLALQDRDKSERNDSWISLSSKIMSEFRTAYIESNVNAGDLSFCYRLLSHIKLHRIVHQVLDNGSFSDDLLGFLRLASQILATCIGPLCFQLHTVETKSEARDGTKMPTICTFGAECMKQAISLYETIIQRSVENPCDLHQADVFMKDLFQCISKDSVTPDCLENAASFLAVIGKRRHDRKEFSSALAPLLYSTKLFLHYSRLCTSESSMKQLRISGRLSFLSSVYKALGLEDEAFLSLSLALVFDAVETPLLSNQQGEDPFISLISFLTPLTRDVVSGDSPSITGSGKRSALINALLQTIAKRPSSIFRLETKDDATVCSELGPDCVVDILLESLHGRCEAAIQFKRFCGVPFGITGIFKAIFSRKTQLYFSPSIACAFWPEMTLTLAEILARSAKILCRPHDLQSVENFSTDIIEKYDALCQLPELFALRIEVGDRKPIHVALSIIYVIASVSMLIYDSVVDFNEWSIKFFCREKSNLPIFCVELAEKYATKAVEILEELNDRSCEWDLVSSAILVAVEVFRFQIACLKDPFDPSHTIDLQQIRLIVQKLVHFEPSNRQLHTISHNCILGILARLQDLFNLQGEELRAVQVALWAADVSRDIRGQNAWFEACAQSLLATVSTVSGESNFELENITKLVAQPAETEANACRLRLFVNSDKKAADLQCLLQGLLQTLEVEVSISEEDPDFRLLQWSKTTILLVLSECAWKKSDILTVINFLKKCFASCKKILHLRDKEKRSAFRLNYPPFWLRIANSSIPAKCIERQAACLQGIGLLYSQLGNYRKSLEYAKLALDVTRGSLRCVDESKGSFSMFLDCSRNQPCRNSLEMKLRRLYLRLKALSCPLDVVHGAISVDDHFFSLSKAEFPRSLAAISANRELEGIRDLFEAHNMLVGYNSLTINPHNRSMHIRSKDRLGKFLHIPDGGILNDLVAAGTERRFKLIPQLQFDSQLWDAAYAFAELHRNNPTADAEALKNLKLISKSVACSNASRAFANYVLGFSFVWKARQSGTLQKLWSNSGRDDACPFLTKAQHHYKEAFHLLGSVCDLLKRNITRCLALVTGPSDYSCALVLASIGAAIFPSSIYDEKLKEENKTILDLLNTFDGMGKLNAESSHVLDELAKKSPPGWRYVASALCPTGEMLLASIDRDDNGESAACRVCCIFPTQKSGPQSTSSLFPASVFDEVMRPLNEIMHKSRHQLLSVLDAVAKEEKHSYRRQWWKGREDVDSKLRDLILATETRILEDPLAHQILVGSEDFNAENERMNDENSAHLARANLASRFEAVSYDSTRCRLSKLKASDLRDELLKKGFKSQSLQKMKKTELIELIITQTEEGSVTMQEIDIELNSRKEKEKDNEHCIFLILDENLQRFPFESMRCFQDKTICRLPTIQIALLRLLGTNREHKYWTSVFDMRKTSYVLDPESNLSGTKERLLPYLEGFNKRNDNMWQSVVGKIPHASFITDSLRKEHGLFLYFGHGGGQKYISRKDIESLKQTPTRTISSVILMGCSSGKLESVNIRGSGFLGELPIQYEPEGIALSYLLAGSPCVVGNLWDVTDRDIDRFSIELLEQLFGSDINYSIARSVAHVRTACKMRYIVGSAPVCYGFPVFPAN